MIRIFLKSKRVIVEIELLLSLFTYGCQYKPCPGKSEVTNVKFEAGCCNVPMGTLGHGHHPPCCATKVERPFMPSVCYCPLVF